MDLWCFVAIQISLVEESLANMTRFCETDLGQRDEGEEKKRRGVGVYEAWRPSQLSLAVSRRFDKNLPGQTVR